LEWSRGIARIALALTVVFLPLGSVAPAGPKEDVSAATSEWGKVLGEDDPDKVLPLYADDAVLWGTLSPTVRADQAALRDYFVTAFRVLPGLKVTFGNQFIRVYGNAAVNTGYYTFSYSKWRSKDPASALQLYLHKKRRALAHSRSPFFGNASSSEIGSIRRPRRLRARSGCGTSGVLSRRAKMPFSSPQGSQ
jgi:hypothetical protein